MMFFLSYPRSGSTWIRNLVETRTGHHTSSRYSAEGLMPRPEGGVFYKTHELDDVRGKPFILLVRHPGDCIESCVRYEHSLGQIGVDEDCRYNYHIKNWADFHREALHLDPERIYHYEQFHGDGKRAFLDQLIRDCGWSPRLSKDPFAVNTVEKLRKKYPGHDWFFRKGKIMETDLGDYAEHLRLHCGPVAAQLGYDL